MSIYYIIKNQNISFWDKNGYNFSPDKIKKENNINNIEDIKNNENFICLKTHMKNILDNYELVICKKKHYFKDVYGAKYNAEYIRNKYYPTIGKNVIKKYYLKYINNKIQSKDSNESK